MRSFLLALTLTLSTLGAIRAEAQLGVGSRPLGLGGAYTAVADDIYAPFWNPAGVASLRGFRASLTNVQLRTTGPNNIFDLMDHFPSDTDSQIELVRRFGKGNSVANASANFAISAKGFALTVVPFADGLISPNNGAGFTYVTTPTGDRVPAAGSVGVINGGYGFLAILTASTRTDRRTTAGVNLKLLNQQSTNINVTFTDNLGNATVVDTTNPNTSGFGMDLGVLYESSKTTTVGASLQNFIRPSNDDRFPTRLNAGIAYRPFANFVAAADLSIDGISDAHLNLGAEYSFGRAFTLRTGVFEGQPMLGLGLFNILNVAYSPNNTIFSFGFSF